MRDMQDHSLNPSPRMGISGRIAAYFQGAQITPLLALVAFLLGLFAVLVTPREEEPQIDVTMANVIVPFPGASAKDVEAMVATPAEQVLSQMTGVEHVMSVSRPGVAVVTVQFKVGVPRQAAVVRLYDTVGANADWLPQGLGVLQPIIKPKGVDDVPIVALTLHSTREGTSAFDLERVARSVEAEIKRVPGTREVKTVGGPGRAVMVEVDPTRLAAVGLTLHEVRGALQSANMGLPVGDVLQGNQAIAIETGPYLHSAQDVAELVLAHDKGWDAAKVAELAKSGPLHNEVLIEKRIPMHIAYFTAWVDDKGTLKTYSDIYGHEKRVTQALDGNWKQIAKGRDHLAPVVPNKAHLDAKPVKQAARGGKSANDDFLNSFFGGGY